jgi:cyclohexanone monooxygenase
VLNGSSLILENHSSVLRWPKISIMPKGFAGRTPKELGFDPEALEKRYREEREKRLRKDGNSQYQDLAGALAYLKLDIFSNPKVKRPPISVDTPVLIIGGGYGGLLVAVRLSQRGFTNFTMVEKGGFFGGTWYWNQYPGLLSKY